MLRPITVHLTMQCAHFTDGERILIYFSRRYAHVNRIRRNLDQRYAGAERLIMTRGVPRMSATTIDAAANQ